MRSPCACARVSNEEREDNCPRLGLRAVKPQYFSSSSAIVAQPYAQDFNAPVGRASDCRFRLFYGCKSEKPDRLKHVLHKSEHLEKIGERNETAQPNESISLLMVRFKSLSLRRSASILLIECRTVVWCLPPNCRPISGSDAGGELLFHQVHRNLPRKGDCLCVRADFQIRLAQSKLLADFFLDQVNGDALFLGGNDITQHLLRRH